MHIFLNIITPCLKTSLHFTMFENMFVPNACDDTEWFKMIEIDPKCKRWRTATQTAAVCKFRGVMSKKCGIYQPSIA